MPESLFDTHDANDPGNWTGGEIGKGECKGTNYGISAASYPDLGAVAAETYSVNPTWTAGDLAAIYTVRKGIRIIAIRGTTRDPRDWTRDLSAWPAHDRDLGFCHAGFLAGAWELYWRSPLADDDFRGAIIVGHSMGGALAILLGAILTTENSLPRAIVTFGAPRCASWKVRRLLRELPLRLYRNGDDPVPDVPWLPGLYVHPRRLIQIGEAALDPFNDHHISVYCRVMEDIQ